MLGLPKGKMSPPTQDRSGMNQPDFLLDATKPPAEGSSAYTAPRVISTDPSHNSSIRNKVIIGSATQTEAWNTGAQLLSFKPTQKIDEGLSSFTDITNFRIALVLSKLDDFDAYLAMIKSTVEETKKRTFYVAESVSFFPDLEEVRNRIRYAGVVVGLTAPIVRQGISLADFSTLDGNREKVLAVTDYGKATMTNLNLMNSKHQEILGYQDQYMIIKPVSVLLHPKRHDLCNRIEQINSVIAKINQDLKTAGKTTFWRPLDPELETCIDLYFYTNRHNKAPKRAPFDSCIYEGGKNDAFRSQPKLTSGSYKTYVYRSTLNGTAIVNPDFSCRLEDAYITRTALATKKSDAPLSCMTLDKKQRILRHITTHEQLQEPLLTVHIKPLWVM